MEFGIILALLAMLSWGVGDFFIQRATRKIGDLETLTYIGLIGSVIIFPFVIHEIPLLFSPPKLLLIVGLGIVTFIAGILNFEALKKGKLSVIEVVLELELPITIALSFIFFGERLNAWQYAIIGGIIIGIVLMATKSFTHFRTKLESGVLVALAAAVFMGGVNLLTGASSKNVSPLMAIWGTWVVFTIVCLIALWRRGTIRTFVGHSRRWTALILTIGIVDTVAWLFYSFAVYSNLIAITTAISESYPAVAMFLGVLVNKENVKWHQYLGAACALFGSILLSLTV